MHAGQALHVGTAITMPQLADGQSDTGKAGCLSSAMTSLRPSLRRGVPRPTVGMVLIVKHRLAGSDAYHYRRAMAPSRTAGLSKVRHCSFAFCV